MSFLSLCALSEGGGETTAGAETEWPDPVIIRGIVMRGAGGSVAPDPPEAVFVEWLALAAGGSRAAAECAACFGAFAIGGGI